MRHSGRSKVSCPKNATLCPRPRLEPRPIDPESSGQTIRLPHIPHLNWSSLILDLFLLIFVSKSTRKAFLQKSLMASSVLKFLSTLLMSTPGLSEYNILDFKTEVKEGKGCWEGFYYNYLFKWLSGILRNWEYLCDIRPACHLHRFLMLAGLQTRCLTS